MNSNHQNPVASRGELYLTILGMAGVGLGLWLAYEGVAAASLGPWSGRSGSTFASFVTGAMFLACGARLLWQGRKVRRLAANPTPR
jgi:hypothetical protein